MNSFLLVTKLPTRFYTWMAWIPASLKKSTDGFKALISNSPWSGLISMSIIQGKIWGATGTGRLGYQRALGESVHPKAQLIFKIKYEGSQAIKGPTAHSRASYQDLGVFSPNRCHQADNSPSTNSAIRMPTPCCPS
jgi:hypothetical protein